MLKLVKRVFVAFFTDEAAFLRWWRAGQAALAIVLISVLTYAGTDPAQIIAVVKTWSPGDWLARIALGFLFSSVHTGKPSGGAESKA